MSFLKQESCALWVVDVQEKLFPLIDRNQEMLERLLFFLEVSQKLELPLVVTEQYPKGLGKTIETIGHRLPVSQPILTKTSFSGLHDPKVWSHVEKIGALQWILVGVEAHICVLQTAKDLMATGHEVIILNDAVSSRSMSDFSTAINEYNQLGVRVTSTEAALYELLRDANHPAFKDILSLVKT